MLRAAAEEIKHTEGVNGGQDGILGRALAEESVLNQIRSTTVPDIPEKLVTNSQMQKQISDQNKQTGVEVLGKGGLGNLFG